MIKTYGVLSPGALIELFEMRARLEELMSTSMRPMEGHLIAAGVWREAVDILKRTEFVGWEDHISTTERKPDGHDKNEDGKRVGE